MSSYSEYLGRLKQRLPTYIDTRPHRDAGHQTEVVKRLAASGVQESKNPASSQNMMLNAPSTQVNSVYKKGHTVQDASTYLDYTAGQAVSSLPSSGLVFFDYTGADQTFTVPVSVYGIEVYIWGAGGGTGYDFGLVNASGGGGAYVAGSIQTTPGQQFTLVVGQAGRYRNDFFNTGSRADTYGGGGGGQGGGGASVNRMSDGGGRSAIRVGGEDIVTAAGGGGGANGGQSGRGGGAGGVLVGQRGNSLLYLQTRNAESGGGGDQTQGGQGGDNGNINQIGQTGGKYLGGSSGGGGVWGGGGGGGWYGGGAGAYSGAGGGGSSYTGGLNAVLSVLAGSGTAQGNASSPLLAGRSVGFGAPLPTVNNSTTQFLAGNGFIVIRYALAPQIQGICYSVATIPEYNDRLRTDAQLALKQAAKNNLGNCCRLCGEPAQFTTACPCSLTVAQQTALLDATRRFTTPS